MTNKLADRLDALANRCEGSLLPPRDIKLLRSAALLIRSLEERLTYWVRRAAALARERGEQ